MTDLSMASGLVLVFGASGYIGTNLVKRLRHLDRPVRASARNRSVLEGRGWDGVELVDADALKPETLGSVLAGVDTAYYLVHSMAAGRHFADLDRQAAENFRQAAEQAGVRRIVYLGGLIPPNPVSEHLRSRLETGACLRAGSVPVTELRAGMVVGPGSAAFEVVRDLVNHLPLMVTPRWVHTRSSPIALDNLLEYMLQAPYVDEMANTSYDVGGPEVLTYADIMRQYGEVVGRRPIIIPVPLLNPRLSSYWLRLVTSVPTNIARALIEGLKQDVIADDAPIRALIRLPLLNFEQSVRAALDAERSQEITARWTEGSIVCRDYHPEYAFYAKRASGSAVSSASIDQLWRQIISIGGRRGYYYLNSLWVMRGVIDWLLGGPSYRRGRRHWSALRVGDTVDAWRVISVEPKRRLTLLMEMKAPGAGVLEFELKTGLQGQRVTATAYFHPAGALGLVYWYLMSPFHWLIFRGLTRAIATRASAAEQSAGMAGQDV
ncbi:MAG: SDR family oxidoreductase [Thiogranum sp.]